MNKKYRLLHDMNLSRHQFIITNSFKEFPLDDSSVDLVVTSPPYPMIEMWDSTFNPYLDSNYLDKNCETPSDAFQEIHSLLDKTWAQCLRVLKPGGFICINIGDATRTFRGEFSLFNNHARILQFFQNNGITNLPGVIWRKPTNSPTKFMGSGMLPAGAYVTLEHEHILIFRKDLKRKFGKPEKDIRSRSAYFWEERNQWFSDCWEILGEKQSLTTRADRKRSAAYPLEIPLRLILMYSLAGDTVLDPFSGLGTTSIAALLFQRNSIAFEIDEKLHESALLSFKKHGTKEQFNQAILDRLKTHNEYVASKDQLFFTYLNKNLKTPVKTAQEKNLDMSLIKSIVRDDQVITAQYRKIKGSELQESGSL